jgi:hypothetical protein
MHPATVRRLARAALACGSLALAGWSCTEKVAPPSAPAPTMSAVPDSVQTILTSNCALSGCHVTGTAFAGEVLEAAVAYQTTVNVPSQQRPEFMRIRPAKPDSSYLVKKIRGDGGIAGGRMPLGGPFLSAAQIATIENWVAAGAPAMQVPVAANLFDP